MQRKRGRSSFVFSKHNWVQFFIIQGPRVLKTLEDIGAVFKLVAEGGERLINVVAEKTEAWIVRGIPVLFDLVATALSVPEIPQTIRNVFGTVRRTAQKPAIDLLRWLFKPVLNLLDGLLKRLVGSRPLTEEVPATTPKAGKPVKAWLEQTRTGRVRVMIATSPAISLDDWIKRLPRAKQTEYWDLKARLEQDGLALDAKQKGQLQLAGGQGAAAKRAQVESGFATGKEATRAVKDLTELANKVAGVKPGAGCMLPPGKGQAAPKRSCFVAEMLFLTTEGRRHPEEIGPGTHKVVTYRAGDMRGRAGVLRDGDPRTLRVVWLRLDYEDGSWTRVGLLRGVEFLALRGVAVGGKLRLNMPEMGAVGLARVTSIAACPKMPKGEGQWVTGWFEHSPAEVWELHIKGEGKPIVGTGTHPFWSVDRRAWVSLVHLEIGERVEAKDGSTPQVLGRTLRARPERVYNIEVDGDHCYRVGEQGLLVHNASFAPGGCDPCRYPMGATKDTIEEGGTEVRSSYSYIMSSGVRQVCQVFEIEGTFKDSTDHPQAKLVRDRFRVFFFNKGTGATTSALQSQYEGKYVAGHLLADSLGGPNDNRNLVMMDTNFNNGGAWTQLEGWLRHCLADRKLKTGYIRIKVTYPHRTDAERDQDPLASYVPSKFAVTVDIGTTNMSKPITFTISHPNGTFSSNRRCW